MNLPLKDRRARGSGVEIWLAESSLDKVLRRSVDDNAWDEESDEVWRGMDRSSRYGRVLWPRETESLPERHAVRVHAQDAAGRPAPAGCGMLRQLSKAVRDDI